MEAARELNTFENTMTDEEWALLAALKDPDKCAEIINALLSDELSRGFLVKQRGKRG